VHYLSVNWSHVSRGEELGTLLLKDLTRRGSVGIKLSVDFFFFK
jgi:hypothetical protein